MSTKPQKAPPQEPQRRTCLSRLASALRRRLGGLEADLPRIVEDYIWARQVCPKQAERMKLHVKKFTAWRGRKSFGRGTLSQELNEWLASLASSHSPSTVNGHRQTIVSLLRFATPEGTPLPRTDRIRRSRQPDQIRVAFTRDEILQLIAAAPSYAPVTERTFGRGIAGDTIPRHRPDGVPWSVWWEAFVRVGYESGQYLSDLRRIAWRDLRPDGIVTFVRHKTGKANSFRLSGDSVAACKRLGHPDLLLPWEFDMAAYFAREFRKFCEFAGVRSLGPNSLRRSAITYTYIERGEEAAKMLAGHSSFATTSRHYIDWTIATRPIASPPALRAMPEGGEA